MKIVLETTDLLEILGLHLGRQLTPEQVLVRTEPSFEIEIDGAVGVEELTARRDLRAVAGYEAVDAGDTLVGTRKPEKAADDGMSMRDLLAYSRQIEEGIQSMPRR